MQLRFIFHPDHHQLSIILDILGTPTLDDFYAITSSRSREYIRALPFRKKKPFSTLFPRASPAAVDLLEKLLTFSPKRRISVDEALAHPYLESYHDPQDEPNAEPLDASFFDFENEKLTKEDLKGQGLLIVTSHLIRSFRCRLDIRGGH
jgi:mitogen-activated protein kinase 1/3